MLTSVQDWCGKVDDLRSGGEEADDEPISVKVSLCKSPQIIANEDILGQV
jgi:hypothetical protein